MIEALGMEPLRGGWWQDLATLQYALGEWDACIHCFQQAAQLGSLRKTSTDVLRSPRLNLLSRDRVADVYLQAGRYHEELAERRRLADTQPDNVPSLLRLARSMMQAGFTDDCVRLGFQLLGIHPHPQLHSEYLCSLLHQSSQSGEELRLAHEGWASTHVIPSERTASSLRSSARGGRIRVGYVCGESNADPSYFFLLSLLQNHDRNEFEVFWYDASRGHNPNRLSYRALAEHWRHIGGVSAVAVAEQIGRDAVDVLVDVSGHYPDHRLDVFALRPARVQMAFPNYPCTTGVSAIDYIFTDEWVCPQGGESQYTETPLRIPGGYLTYAPPAAPAIGPPPYEVAGFVTFGLFQRPAKYHALFWDCVAQVLLGVAGSRLLIHYGAFELDDPDSAACMRFRSELQSRGVEGQRIQFAGRMDPLRHLAAVSSVDIALDSFPYTGQTTTCECLWMGVPVVTLAGQTHVSRVSFSILGRMGLGELCADSTDAYVRIAVALGTDGVRLRDLRNSLRERMAASEVCSFQSVREIEEQYRFSIKQLRIDRS
ncbi:MAG: hypothetical protein H7039_16680 [Bryobacteraceae bacterium]|nr:hypothetical protein [Bryobacteraceae bacterium]